MAQRLSFVLHHGYRSNAPLSDPWPWLLGYSAVPARERSWLCQVTCESDGGVHTGWGAKQGAMVHRQRPDTCWRRGRSRANAYKRLRHARSGSIGAC